MSISVEPFQVPQLAFSWATLQQCLQAITEGSTDEAWTCAIFWQSSVNAITGSSCLIWGDGYYKGCDRDEKGPSKRQPTTPAVQAAQEHRRRVLRELNSLMCGNAAGPALVDDIFRYTSSPQSVTKMPLPLRLLPPGRRKSATSYGPTSRPWCSPSWTAQG